ncbi:MAG TPA: hypothetical protein ENH01_01180 [Nitrospirae bacterium]|nr:hypothetical protein [Nitrospirota bacterium]
MFTGNVVYLDGSGSSDPDNGPMPLSYNWSFDVLPPESGLSDNDIIDKEQVNASFIPDADGSYVLELVVNDGEFTSEDYVIITAATPNVPPNADAGDDITVSLGETAILDGSASSDPDDGPDLYDYDNCRGYG